MCGKSLYSKNILRTLLYQKHYFLLFFFVKIFNIRVLNIKFSSVEPGYISYNNILMLLLYNINA